MAEPKILDVTLIEPRLKHPTIFQYFDALQDGEAFIIHNDHDPKPLYYQLLGERGDIFTWEYQLQGPTEWLIRIAKKKPDERAASVGDIAASDLRKADVFRKYGIDFCCDGKKSLQEACAQAGVEVQTLTQELEQLGQPTTSADKDYNHWDLDFLADYIVQVHHKFVMSSIPALTELSEKVTHRHGSVHPELLELKRHVVALLTEMRSHQIKEERVLFPFIKQLAQCLRENKKAGDPPFGTVESPVQMMIDDHAAAAAHVREIARLTSAYQVPQDGCDSYKLYYAKLQAFNTDLELHLHLENNILFPKSVELERELIG